MNSFFYVIHASEKTFNGEIETFSIKHGAKIDLRNFFHPEITKLTLRLYKPVGMYQEILVRLLSMSGQFVDWMDWKYPVSWIWDVRIKCIV